MQSYVLMLSPDPKAAELAI